MVLTKRPDSYYGSRRPTVSNRTRFLATPKTVTSFLVGANARYHSRSPFLISAFQLFPCGFTEPALVLGQGQARAPNPLPTPSIGTVPPAPDDCLATFRPLHSAAFQFRRLHFHFTSFRRPQIGETVKKTSCAPAGFRRPRDFVRPRNQH